MTLRVVLGALIGVLFGLLGNGAFAADKPMVAPVPGWVRPAPEAPSPDAGSSGLPFVLLLNDIQLSFDGDGWSEFHLFRAKIQTQAGLQAAGAIPFAWAPYSDTLTFHSATITRNGATIDVLPKGGSFTVLRRETGLASAMLTGELTAVLQPEGLQVGDVLEIAVTIRHSEPLLKAIPSALVAAWDQGAVMRYRLTAQWPSSMHMRWRETRGLPALTKTEAGGRVIATLQLDNVRPAIAPAGAPVRFNHGRQIEFSAAASWQDLAEVMAPLYEAAAKITPGSALSAKIDEIAKAGAEPKARAAAALALVEDQVRYLAHADQDRGYMPQSAEDTWRLRYGDCKAKTALLLAILRRLGVQAEPVLANASAGDAINGRLPSAAVFNHVLLRVSLGGKVYWLDGTRTGDRNLDQLDIPALGWVLPLVGRPATLVQLTPLPPVQPQISSLIRYDASKGASAPYGTHFQTVFRGDVGYAMHTVFAAVAGAQHEAALKAFWANQHSAFTASSMSETWDPVVREETIVGDGSSKLELSSAGLELQHVEFGGKPEIDRDPDASDPDAPYLTSYPLFTEVDESVVLAPGNQMTPEAMSATDEDLEVGGVAYQRKGTYRDNVARVVYTMRALRPEISVAEARASVEPLTRIGKIGVYIPPGAILTTRGAMDSLAIDSTSTSAAAHIDRGNALLDFSRYAEARSEFDAAIAMEPSSQLPYADRALARAWLGDPGALADAEKAEALGGPSPVSVNARGLIAEKAGKFAEARIQYRRSLAIDPKNQFSVLHLFLVDLRDFDATTVRADLDRLVALAPELEKNAYGEMARVLWQSHHDRALMNQAIKLMPADTVAGLFGRALSHLYSGALGAAQGEVAALLKLKATPEAWMLKATVDQRDLAQTLADLDEALKLDPDNLGARRFKLSILLQKQDYPSALVEADRLLASHPEARGEALVNRAAIHHKLGHEHQADADFAEARALTGSAAAPPTMLCAEETEARWRADLALSDCERAMASDPKSEPLLFDRFAQLHRLGRDADARASLAGVEQMGFQPADLNNLCYSMARENFDLERALEFCDVAVKLLPGPGFLDSRAFVLLRMGRNPDALVAYTTALSYNQHWASALFGRGVIEARLGQREDSERDITAAEKANPAIRKTFADMGVTAP